MYGEVPRPRLFDCELGSMLDNQDHPAWDDVIEVLLAEVLCAISSNDPELGRAYTEPRI